MMEWLIKRNYYEESTHGALFINKQFVCFTIELPWKENKKRISCIPEGIYPLQRRISQKFGNHLLIKDVPGRSLILLHPANNAKQELQGCIAPVMTLNGMGKGMDSKRALNSLLMHYQDALETEEDVYLSIKYNTHEFSRTLQKSDSQIF